jgi:hypothetical protein
MLMTWARYSELEDAVDVISIEKFRTHDTHKLASICQLSI